MDTLMADMECDVSHDDLGMAVEHDLQKWAGGDVHQRIKDESQ